MATRDFTAFIMKCVAKTFPGADLNKGSPVWTFLINPVIDYMGIGALDLQSREFIKTVLRSKFPSEELDKDGVIDDIVIKPAEAILAPVTREIQQIKLRQTLSDLRYHTIESIGDISSNFGVVPTSGDYARGSVRLYYAAPVNERVVPETYVESTSGGLRFFAVASQSISASEMALNQENDLYYWDIRVVAEKPGSVYNVSSGSITRAPTLSRVVRVMNLYNLAGGLARDTVESVAAELESYPCTRSIGTRRGTVATIQALIGGARTIEMVGMGDPEMQRDVIRGGEIQPGIVLYPTGNRGSGSYGYAVPDNASLFTTRWMEDPLADFVALLGSSLTEVTGYYLCMVWDVPGADPFWTFSRITRVLSVTRIEVEDSCIPVTMHGHSPDKCIRWGVFPAKLTLSEVPGGILWPDTPDGLVAIRDNEIHVGGCSDGFMLGADLESTSTSMKAVSDETPLGYGTNAYTHNGYDFVWLDDASLEEEIIGANTAVWLSPALIEFSNVIWGITDLTELQAGQVFEGATLPAVQRYFIVSLGKNAVTGALQVTLDADPGDPGAPFVARVIKRKMGANRDACLHIVGGVDEGYYKVLVEIEGSYADVCLGVLQGCRYRVLLDRPLTATAGPFQWELVDRIDINLNEPKILRVFGTDLNTFAGSASAFATSTDFSLYGVQQGDIVKIESGPDSGTLHVLGKDPFGLGSHFLEFTEALTATAVVSFSVYSASTPISLPLVSVSKVSLLDASGAGLGLDVPYKDPLATYSSEFTNLSAGVKSESSDWTVGISSVDGPQIGGAAAVFNASTRPFDLWVWHRQLGYKPPAYVTSPAYADGDMELPEGGFITPVVYTYALNVNHDLSTTAGWDDLVAELNAPTPYPFWAWTTREGSGGALYGILICRPFGSSFMLVACSNNWMSPPAPSASPIRFEPFLNYTPSRELFISGASLKPNHVTSKDLYYGRGYPPVSSDLATLRPPLNLDQDIVDVYTGSNIDTKDTLMQIDTLYRRFRIHGRRSFHPEMFVSTRMGFPSSGTAKIYFRDPTDIEIGPDTRMTVDSSQVYWPDPLLNGVIVPGYPETEKPDDGNVSAVTADMSVFDRDPTEPTFVSLGVKAGDILEISYKDLVTGRVWAGPFVLGALQYLGIRQLGKPDVVVTFIAATYTMTDVINLINAAAGVTLAVAGAGGAVNHIVLRWQERIEIYGTAIGAGTLLDTCAQTTNVAASFGLWPILESIDPGFSNSVTVRGALSASDGVGSNTQFRVLRKSTQRFSAQEIASNAGPGGLYYAEGEFLSWGVGNQFNIDSDVHGVLSGHWSRGYSLSCENQELSYSMAEIPWISLGNYFQAPTVSDDMPNDQVVLGGGIRIYYDRSPLVYSAQALMTSRAEKDNIQSALARHLFPHYVSCTLAYAGGSLPATIKPEITDLITGRDPTEPLDISDIIGVLTQFGATKVDMPVELAVIRHNKDRSQDVLIGKDRVETTRLTGFLPGNIVLNRRP